MRSNGIVGRRLGGLAALAALSSALAAGSALGQAAGQKTFATAQEATHALYLAIKSDDKPAMMAILGTQKRLVCSENEAQGKMERARFVEKYRKMRRLVREADGRTELIIGAENWPFPFPLASAKGVWHFDAAAGEREILFRRIGANERAAIRMCKELMLARDMRGTTPDAGAKPISGYRFQRLTNRSRSSANGKTVVSNGGTAEKFAFIAYPVEYRSSGVMTFVVARDGGVYAKDLGPNAGKSVKASSAVRPDSTWTVEK